MQKIILTRGLPASGKTTWAREYVGEPTNKTINICKDDLRTMLKGDAEPFDKDVERLVEETRIIDIFRTKLFEFSLKTLGRYEKKCKPAFEIIYNKLK